jgi:hypothetical protein
MDASDKQKKQKSSFSRRGEQHVRIFPPRIHNYEGANSCIKEVGGGVRPILNLNLGEKPRISTPSGRFILMSNISLLKERPLGTRINTGSAQNMEIA